MKMKKFALSLVAVAACAGAFRAYESYQQSGESDVKLLTMGNIEAPSQYISGNGGLSSGDVYGAWASQGASAKAKYDEKTYRCSRYSCTITNGVSFANEGVGGYQEVSYEAWCYDCVSGSEVAHCSECPKPQKKYVN